MGKQPQPRTDLNARISEERPDALSDADLDLVSGGTGTTTSTTSTLSNTGKQFSDTSQAIVQNIK